MTNELETLRPEVREAKDPSPLATGPTKWRAEHCTTHHHACDCREWEHANRVAELEQRAERAEAELAALKTKIDGSRHAFLGPNMDRITFLAEDIGPVGKYALVKVED